MCALNGAIVYGVLSLSQRMSNSELLQRNCRCQIRDIIAHFYAVISRNPVRARSRWIVGIVIGKYKMGAQRGASVCNDLRFPPPQYTYEMEVPEQQGTLTVLWNGDTFIGQTNGKLPRSVVSPISSLARWLFSAHLRSHVARGTSQ